MYGRLHSRPYISYTKHYEFYLANKILKKFIIIHELHIHSLGLFALTAFTLTVPLALCADVISEHCAENEVLFRRKHVERTGQHQAYGVKTLGPTEKRFMRSLPTGVMM